MYIDNQQNYNANGVYAHKSYITNTFKRAILEHTGVLKCEGYDYEKFFVEFMEAPLSEPFLRRRLKMHSRPDGFMS